MSEDPEEEKLSDSMTDRIDRTAGLCATCIHVRQIDSAKGSTFLLCALSAADPQFPKYPRLPVLSCSGYKRQKSFDSSICTAIYLFGILVIISRS